MWMGCGCAVTEPTAGRVQPWIDTASTTSATQLLTDCYRMAGINLHHALGVRFREFTQAEWFGCSFVSSFHLTLGVLGGFAVQYFIYSYRSVCHANVRYHVMFQAVWGMDSRY